MGIQTNTVMDGMVRINAGEDLTGYEGFLVAGQDEGTKLEVIRPSAADTVCHFIVDEASTLDSDAEVLPLVFGQERRLVAKGTITAGDVLVLADPGTAADKGKVRTLPATEGRYFRAGIAEEDAVDGQHVKVRIAPGHEYVGAAFVTAKPSDAAATNTSHYGFSTAAQADALVDAVREMYDYFVANGLKASA